MPAGLQTGDLERGVRSSRRAPWLKIGLGVLLVGGAIAAYAIYQATPMKVTYKVTAQHPGPKCSLSIRYDDAKQLERKGFSATAHTQGDWRASVALPRDEVSASLSAKDDFRHRDQPPCGVVQCEILRGGTVLVSRSAVGEVSCDHTFK